MMFSGIPDLRLIFWEVTVACNLECVHCRRLEVSKSMSRNDLSTESALEFIESLAADFDPKPVLVFSGGEPLERPDLFKLIQFAHEQEIPMALATNGTLINRALSERIVNSGIRRVAISLDGASAEIHDQFRKMPGSFEKAVAGFKHLKTAGMSMQLNATVTKHNVHELEAIYRLALEFGAESLHFFLLVPVGCGLEIKEEYQLTPAEYEKTLLKIYQFSNENKIHIRPICAPHYFRILAQKKSMPARANHNGSSLNQMTRGCLAGTGICFVSHKGDVFPCGYLPLGCGNISTKRLKNIWMEAPAFYMLRDAEFLSGKCGLCEFRRICAGCRARAYEAEGDFLAEEPNCSYEPKGSIGALS